MNWKIWVRVQAIKECPLAPLISLCSQPMATLDRVIIRIRLKTHVPVGNKIWRPEGARLLEEVVTMVTFLTRSPR